MKKLYYFIVAIIGVIVFLQCQKSEMDSAHQAKDPLLTSRSTGNVHKVISPGCDIYSQLQGIVVCGNIENVNYIITTNLGCQISVTMNVRKCNTLDFNGSITGYYIDFRDLEWSLVQPASNDCQNWYNQLIQISIGGNSDAFKNFSFWLQEEFEKKYLLELALAGGLNCNTDPVLNSYYFKSPCLQMCYKEFNRGGNIEYELYLTPCATDGCCVRESSYCYDSESGKLKPLWNSTRLKSPCTEFLQDPCLNDYSAGSCNVSCE
jgi:hypothetical protein